MHSQITIIALVGLCMCVSGCVLETDSGLPKRAGLAGSGDIIIFPEATFGGLPLPRLLSMDAEGLAEIHFPASPLLVKNDGLSFDREGNKMCGVFREPDESSFFYACYDFTSQSMQRLTPKGYSYIDGVKSADGRRMYQVVVIREYVEESPWYFLIDVDLATGEATPPLAVDARLRFGNPQHLTASEDGRYVFVITAPFEEGSYRVELGKPYILQTIDLAEWRMVGERTIPPFVSSSVISEDGQYLLFYSGKYNTIYKYEIARNVLSRVMALTRSTNMMYNVWLMATKQGVLVIDQTEEQTVVRRLTKDASAWESHRFDFTAYTAADVGDGRLLFREYHMTKEALEQDTLPEREDAFYSIDLDSMTVMASQRVSLPGEAFQTGLFYVVPENND